MLKSAYILKESFTLGKHLADSGAAGRLKACFSDGIVLGIIPAETMKEPSFSPKLGILPLVLKIKYKKGRLKTKAEPLLRA
ncbi:MAG: hypothetical protein Q4D82_01245 [Neisseria sp.]|nr:hypothetical protein [Neisseria sp.]